MTSDVLKTVAAAARLAPSAHNTQPWLFALRENALDVYVAWSRHLSVSDPTGRELYVSLGCALTNAQAAAAQAGVGATVMLYPLGEGKEAPVARVGFGHGLADPHWASIAGAIRARRTDRAFYDGRPLTDSEREALPSARLPSVVFIDDHSLMSQIAQLTEQATFSTLSRADFKEELSHWVRHNWTKQSDGMPGYAMGLPAVLSLFAPVMVKMAPIHKQEAPKTRRQIESASAVAVIVTPEDNPRAWLTAGQVLEQLWLEATAAGLAATPMAAAIEAQGDIRYRLQQAIRTTQHPQAILRVGHSPRRSLRPTPRRSTSACLLVQ